MGLETKKKEMKKPNLHLKASKKKTLSIIHANGFWWKKRKKLKRHTEETKNQK